MDELSEAEKAILYGLRKAKLYADSKVPDQTAHSMRSLISAFAVTTQHPWII